MNKPGAISVDCYPWAAPTEEQKRMFDALPREEQLRMVRAAIEEGFASGISTKSLEEILAEVRAEMANDS